MDYEPFLRHRILAWMQIQERPALVREIASALNVPHESLTAVLIRLVRAGTLQRLKAAMTFPYHRRAGHRKTRRVWLYRAA